VQEFYQMELIATFISALKYINIIVTASLLLQTVFQTIHYQVFEVSLFWGQDTLPYKASIFNPLEHTQAPMWALKKCDNPIRGRHHMNVFTSTRHKPGKSSNKRDQVRVVITSGTTKYWKITTIVQSLLWWCFVRFIGIFLRLML